MNTKSMHRAAELLALTILSFLTLAVSVGAQKSKPESVYPQPKIPQPQGFCGYCHILTYPAVINKSYKTWEKGKHNKVGCIECHYAPSAAEKQPPISIVAQRDDRTHIPKAPPGHFSYLDLGGETIKTRPQVLDAGCITAACHGKPDEPFRTKKIKFTEKVPFVHEPHLARKNQIEGMQVNCTSCHQHETETKHFQVLEATCHLCHFANTKVNEGRARCELCHSLPTAPIQTSDSRDKKPITHQMLKEAGVACDSCHFDVVRASGETKVEPFFEGGVIKTVRFIGAGRPKYENCSVCHDQTKYLQKEGNKKEMHGRHVTTKNARCFDCHRLIEHRKVKTHDPLPGDCLSCHPEPHRFQRLLAAGPERDGIQPLPDPMFKARASCLACHLEKEKTDKGQTVMKASAKTCVQCHTKDYERMLELWKRELAREIEKAERLEAQALETLTKHESKLTREKLKEANRMLELGRDNLRIVRFGNGVHNAKYSISLLDLANASFKNTIGYLEGKDMSEGIRREE